MTETESGQPLTNIGLLCFPGVYRCEHGDVTPVIVFHIFIGEKMLSIVAKVNL